MRAEYLSGNLKRKTLLETSVCGRQDAILKRAVEKSFLK
jgi:hypothetical protein